MTSFKNRFKVTYVLQATAGTFSVLEGTAVVSAFNHEDAISHFKSIFHLGPCTWDMLESVGSIKDVELIEAS